VKCENFALTLLFLSITQTKGPCGDPGQEGNIVSIHTKDLTSGNAAKCELLEAWRAVANAKLDEYRRQSWRLALLVQRGSLEKRAAIDRLWEIATAHALVRSLGEDRVQAIISEPFIAACAEAA
jgi:hypothetical protein